MKHISTKLQKTTYGTHIYLMCILCGHIILCHNCPYHILVHIHVGNTTTHQEQRLLKCMENAWDEKEKAQKEHDLVKYRAQDLKQLLAHGVEMSNEELEYLVNKIEDYKKQMAQAEKQMESSSLAFLTAHAATMVVLGMVGKVQYHEQFSKKGLRDLRCMFCMMVFDSYKVRNRHIISCHLTVFEATVSISYKCCKFCIAM